MKYEFVVRALIVATIIMCLQALGIITRTPWQLTILFCLIFGAVHQRWFSNKDK